MSTATAAWSSLSSAPGDATRRNQVIATSQAVVRGLQTASAALDAQWTSSMVNAADVVTEANAALTAVADLNRAISTAVGNGQPANELQDQRDQLVGTLASVIGASSVEGPNGTVDVVVGGTTLVSGSRTSQVALVGGTSAATMGTTPVTLTVVNTGGVPLAVGGEVGGQLTSMNSVIPGFRTALDGVAAKLTSGTSAVLATGFDQDGNAGTPLFSGTTAATIGVAITDPRKLAAAGTAPSAGGASSDGRIADAMAQLATAAGSPDATYRSMITDLGVRSRTAAANVTAADAVAAQVDRARSSVSAVSLDEEMTNMLQFKQSYAAAARVMTAIDEMLDVLINKTGLVGR